jgi:amidophosphoribosyltransferase
MAALINQGSTFEEGIRHAQESIAGSCSLLLLTDAGIYVARDRLGRTPVIIGRKPGAHAVTLETCAFPNLGYEATRNVGPGEIVRLTPEGAEQRSPAHERMQICAFLWVYYGYPASSYEEINVESVRNRCGVMLARREKIDIDMVAGIPDSGVGHAIGYASEAGIPYRRPFVKYTPTWPRSFMPQDQSMRDLVAKMKLVPVQELIQGKKMLFCEDSIVRGTQLKDTIQRLYDCGAEEVHMRPACPPLVYGCKFLNFSRSKSELDLAARKAIKEIEGSEDKHLEAYAQAGSDNYNAMLDRIRHRLRLTSLQYQHLPDLVEAIGLPKEKLCTYCWDGAE